MEIWSLIQLFLWWLGSPQPVHPIEEYLRTPRIKLPYIFQFFLSHLSSTSSKNPVMFSLVDDGEKYPPNIQKLFAPKLPFLYKKPTDYPIEKRSTQTVTPISSWKSQIAEYVNDSGLNKPHESFEKSKHKQEVKLQHKETFERQLKEWHDPELLLQNESQFMKDPYKTIFLARIDYSLTELDISKNLNRFGVIESIRIVRDREGKSRGYGFAVFERDVDANNCVRELAPTGLSISGSKRTILVDIERGRVVRNWKPRRLGGGLGGRHYTKPNSYHSNVASAAASGRRLQLLSNPYSNLGSTSTNGPNSSSYQPNKRPAPSRPTNVDNKRPTYSYNAPQASYNSPQASYNAPQAPYEASQQAKPAQESIRDKYAKYSSSTTYKSSSSTQGRSIRSIRQAE